LLLKLIPYNNARAIALIQRAMNLELPTDWGAMKRMPAIPAPSKDDGGRKRKCPPSPSDDGISQQEDEEAQQEKPIQKQHVATNKETEEHHKEDKIIKGPLGPRGIFNAVTHDSPERGQLKQIVMSQLHISDAHPNDDMEEEEAIQMEVHCLLSKLPYQKMLSDLFSHNDDKELLPSPNIPYVTKGYEESFMREPINSTERLCVKGDQCECMYIDAEKPFVGIEFLLPGEKQPSTPHLCVVCCRAITQQLYYDIMFDKHDFGGVIQRFGNIHSQPGEYALDAMLIAAPNMALHIMPLPIVSHQRNRYSVFMKRGIKHLRQSRVYFQNTPLC